MSRHKIYHAANRAKRNDQSRDYHELNKKKLNARRRRYYRKHKRDQIAKGTKRTLKLYHTDPCFRYRVHLAIRIRRMLKTGKSASTMELIGCDRDTLRAHIAGQFTPGMTWDNYGEWHIDHIKACARFDLTDPAEQRKCFNYKNLQPLWKLDNLRKGTRLVA